MENQTLHMGYDPDRELELTGANVAAWKECQMVLKGV